MRYKSDIDTMLKMGIKTERNTSMENGIRKRTVSTEKIERGKMEIFW